ncbi:MAG TPA: hypothetical protein VFL70_10920 [Bacteroidia bacterium]|nr:hypothetical protein [Bacteroidia bacterium]
MKQLKQKPSIILDKRDFKTQLAAGYSFFGNSELEKVKEKDNPYADKDGLIEFICGVELLQDPIITAKLAELKSILISITSVVTSYINRYANKHGAQYKTDPVLWEKALSNIPLMGPSKIDQQTYSRKTRGVEIAGDFINLVLDIAAGEGSALTSFKSFLEKQGNALRAGVEENKDYYKTITIGVSVEVFKVGNEIVYIPKVKQYKVNFSRENSKWSSSCASYEQVSIHFDYMYSSSVFDYEALKNPEIKAEFEKFITGQQKAQIEDATTFFNDDFEETELVEADKKAYKVS